MKLRTREFEYPLHEDTYVCQVIVGPGPSYRNENRKRVYTGSYHSLIRDEASEVPGRKGAYCPTKVCTHVSSAIIPEIDLNNVVTYRTAGDLEVWPLKVGDILYQVCHSADFRRLLPSLESQCDDVAKVIEYHTEDANSFGRWKFKDPTLDRGFSLVNFLIELNEIGMLVKSLKKLRHALRELEAAGVCLRDARHLSKAATWGHLAEFLSEGSLAVAYGIVPLLGDLRKIWEILTRFDRDRKRLLDLKDKGLYQTLTSRVYIMGLGDASLDEVTPRDHIPLDRGGTGPLFTVALDFGLTAEVYTEYSWQPANNSSCIGAWTRHGVGYSYSLPEAKSRYARMWQLLDAWGVNVDLSIVWNATRWTFLLDWFIKVADFCHKTRVPWFPIDVTLSDCMVSYRVKLVRKVYVRLITTGTATIDGFQSIDLDLFRNWACIYDRRRVQPYPIEKTSRKFDRGAVGLRHLWLGGALATLVASHERRWAIRKATYLRKRFWQSLLAADRLRWKTYRFLKRFDTTLLPPRPWPIKIPDGF